MARINFCGIKNRVRRRREGTEGGGGGGGIWPVLRGGGGEGLENEVLLERF